jgi:hypothetical protein
MTVFRLPDRRIVFLMTALATGLFLAGVGWGYGMSCFDLDIGHEMPNR